MLCVARLSTPLGIRPLRLLVPLKADGVEIVDDWYSMGMRGSGSNTVQLDGAVVAADMALYADRLRPRLRPPPDVPDRAEPSTAGEGRRRIPANVLSPGLHIALTVIAASYLGAASGACDEAIRLVAGTSRADSEVSPRLAGLMVHEARVGWWALEAMLRETTDDSVGTRAQMVTTMLGKRQVILSSIRTAELAMELLGSMSYMNMQNFERTLRDVRAGITHPLTPEETLVAVGRANLVLDSGQPLP
jgi:acyl-CoA dehydrogenase